MKIVTRSPGLPVGAAVVLLCAACASAPAAGARDSCVLEARDSVFLARGPVFRDCAVDRKAKLVASSARPDFRPSMDRTPQLGTTCYSAEVRLVVTPEGTVEPGSFRLVTATSPAFGQAVLESVPAWRYRPAQLDGKPVRQIVQEKQMVAIRVSVEGQGRSLSTPRC